MNNKSNAFNGDILNAKTTIFLKFVSVEVKQESDIAMNSLSPEK